MGSRKSVGALLPRLWQALPRVVRRRIIWFTHPTRTVGVSAVLVDDAGDFLLLRHRYRERSGWELPGGLVKAGEQLEAALQRELREETGLRVEIVGLIAAKISPPQHVDVCYVARVLDGELTLDAQEIVEGRFFPHDRLPHLLTAPQLETIALALERTRAT